MIRAHPRPPYRADMEITEAARATRASAPLTPLDPPDAAPARAAFGVVLLHVAFFAVGAVMLLVGFAAAAAQRLAAALRRVRGRERPWT